MLLITLKIKLNQIKNLRDWFKLIYEVVFGEENGPRMGYFVSFFGLKETIELMKDKIKNN